MTFQSSGWLWALLLLPVLAVALLAWARQARGAGAAWADPQVMDVRPSARTRRWRAVAAVVALLAVAAGIVALARPSVETTGEENRSSVMLTIDVSESMKKTDLQPSRLAAAVDAAERFTEEAPKGTAIGITTFADRTAVVLAPTTDRDAVKRALDGLGELRVGTALGGGRDHLAGRAPGRRRHRRPPAGQPLRLAGAHPPADRRRQLDPQRHHPRGGRRSAPPRSASRSTRSCSANDPGRPDQPLPSETLSAMSSSTGGIFAQTTTTADLAAVFADIGSVVAPVEQLRELTVWFAGLAIALLAAAALALGLSRPRPPRGSPSSSLRTSA